MIPQPRPLIEVFADIPDVRHAKGKRHPLPAILSLSCCAMLCGDRSYGAIAEWGRHYGPHLAHALGFAHQTPCAATLFTIFGHLDCEVFEAKLGAWADRVMAHTPATPATPGEAMAVDGKTLRGSKKQGAPGFHLLSVLSHRLGLTLRQQAVDAKTNEIKGIETVLEQIVLKGRVLTMDALLTPRQVAQTMVDAGGRLRHDRQRESAHTQRRYRVGLYLTTSRRPPRERPYGGYRPWAHRDAQSHHE